MISLAVTSKSGNMPSSLNSLCTSTLLMSEATVGIDTPSELKQTDDHNKNEVCAPSSLTKTNDLPCLGSLCMSALAAGNGAIGVDTLSVPVEGMTCNQEVWGSHLHEGKGL